MLVEKELSMVEKINSDELISLIKKFVINVKNETIGLKASEYKKEYKHTILNAHFYKAYGGNSKFVNTPWITFLAHDQKTKKGIYPSLFYDRKCNTDNFSIGYGISETNTPDVSWNIDFSKYHSNNANTFFRKLLLTIENESDIDKHRDLIISSLNEIIQDFHNQFKTTSYWLYAAGEKSYKWDEFYRDGIIALGWDDLGDLENYNSQEEIAKELQKHDTQDSYPMNNSKANWEFVKEINIGDIVYVKKGIEPVLLGRGVVESDYIYDDKRNEYKSIRKVNWTHNGVYNVDFNELDIKQWNQKTLTNISENKYKDFWKKIEKVFNNNAKEDKNMISQPLNQILYGPPGTGKTYNTVIKAIEIIKPELIQRDENGNVKNYDELKIEFDKLRHQGQIEFVTFHQSYSYEEFVEGIKPDLENEHNLKYKLGNGIFKKICTNANELLENKVEHNFKKDNISVYKILIPDELLFEYCVENNCVAINWGNDIDISDCNNLEEITAKIPENVESRKQCISQLNLFKLWIDNDLKSGKDVIVVVPGSMNTIKGIAKITGDYFFNPDIENGHQQRKVEWIRKNINISSDSIYNSKFVSPTVTGMYSDKISWEAFLNLINNKNISKSSKAVLIIDEINRGNISKIFGELITLIEKDKRGSLSVKLPYSQDDFTVPQNLYIIGTMNTSDRSIASIDIALRRRFKFVEMMPKPEIVADFGCNFKTIFEKLNTKIKVLLDRDHQIGHSYFINTKYANADINTLKEIWFSEIIPLLNEYFYCDWEKLKLVIPGFIKTVDNIPEELKNECEDSIYEFKTPDEVLDFKGALNQDKFKQEN